MDVVSITERLNQTLARQLGRPAGVVGRLVGRSLNRSNQVVVAGAVEAAALEPGQAAADIGFGGGVGLAALLSRVGDAGQVHGVEISPTMVAAARRRFRRELVADRLRLHEASMDRLPIADASLDGVISTNTIYFIEDLGSAFRSLARVLRPSGRAVLGIGDPAAMAGLPFTEHGFRLRPVAEVVEHLREAGLELVEDRNVGDARIPFHLLICARR